MVTYNCAKTIEKSLLSIINQDYSNLEFVIADGESTDDTLNIIRKYSDKITTIVSEPDHGIYDAMNKCLRLATGDYLIFMGSDDLFRNNHILTEITSYLNSDAIYYGNVYRTCRKDIYCGKYNSFKFAVKNISHQALFYPKSVYKNHTYKLEYRLFADWVYNMELWNNYKFQYMPVTVTDYNDVGASNSQKDDCFFRDYKMLVCDNIGKLQYYYAEAYHFLRNLIKKDKIRTR